MTEFVAAPLSARKLAHLILIIIGKAEKKVVKLMMFKINGSSSIVLHRRKDNVEMLASKQLPKTLSKA